MFDKFATKIRSSFSKRESGSPALLSLGRSVILTSMVVAGVVVGVRQLGLLAGLELGSYDQLMRSRPDEGPDNRLLVVGVNEGDIQSRKEYPLKDETVAQLLEKLQQYQPRAIGLDILRDVPQGSPQGRIALEKTLKQSENIIAVCQLSSTTQPGIAAPPGVTEERVGFSDLPLDPGGTLRRSLLLSTPTSVAVAPPVKHLCNIPDPENQLPSFSLQLALLYLQAQNIQPELTKTGELKIGSTVFNRLGEQSGGYRKTGAKDYQLMLNYRSSKNAVKQVSLTDVLNNKISPSLVKDRIVLIGYTAPIVKDDFYTPYSAGLADSQKMPGVVIQAQNISQILSAVVNHRPLIGYWSEGNEILWIWGWSVVGAILAWRIRRPWLFGLGVVVAAGVLYGTCYWLLLGSQWIPLVPAIIGLVAASVIGVLIERGYAKAIYQEVKKFVLNVEVNEEEKQQQVEAITENESFAQLQQKAAGLRKNRRRERTSENAAELSTHLTGEVSSPTNEATRTLQGTELQPIEMTGKDAYLTNEAMHNPPGTGSTQEDTFSAVAETGKTTEKDRGGI